jgi:hypothetical protein
MSDILKSDLSIIEIDNIVKKLDKEYNYSVKKEFLSSYLSLVEIKNILKVIDSYEKKYKGAAGTYDIKKESSYKQILDLYNKTKKNKGILLDSDDIMDNIKSNNNIKRFFNNQIKSYGENIINNESMLEEKECKLKHTSLIKDLQTKFNKGDRPMGQNFMESIRIN